MENFEKILLFHLKKYPLMTPQDAVKLCYQSAYGCGHLVNDKEKALSMLKKEMENIFADDDAQLSEPIGNGYIRLDLHAAKAKNIPTDKICEVFVKSASEGRKTEFGTKTEILKKLADEEKTPFSKTELERYLSGYRGEPVRHSEEYRAAYYPSYRVIMEEFEEELQ